MGEIMEQKQGKHNEEYKYLDPKILRGQDGAQIPRTKTPFNDAIVFVVGGGNYIEYQNLQDYSRNKNATFGSSARKLKLETSDGCYHFYFSVRGHPEENCVRLHPVDEC